MKIIRLPSTIVSQLFSEAQRNPNIEACGLVSKKENESFQVYPIENIAPKKECLFEMEPAQLIAAMKSMRETQEELFAIYHTHPHGPAEPSVTDIEQTSYPGVLNLIIALDTKKAPEMRGFYICNEQGEQIELKIC